MAGFPVLHYLLEFTHIMPIESVMPSNRLILCCPLLLLPPISPSIRVFSNESALCIRWPKDWSFSLSISHPSMSHSSSQDMACIHSLLLGSRNFFFSSLGLTPWLLISLMLLYWPCGSPYTCSFVRKCSLQYLISSVPSACPQNPDGSSLDTSCNLHGR